MKRSSTTGAELPDYFFDDPDRAEAWLTETLDREWRKKHMDTYKGELATVITKLNWLIARSQAGAVRVNLESNREALTKLEDRLAAMTPEQLRQIIA